MQKAKIFRIDGSQAIRLPKDFHVDADEVFLKKVPEGFLVMTRDPWELFREAVEQLSDDFFAEGRQQPPLQKRNWNP
jgi:antitoxin VapB